MSIPNKSNKGWADIVSGRTKHQLKFLAAKVLLGRLVHAAQENPSPAVISAGVEQLHELYSKNAHMPSVQEDMKTIFG
ncbi:hypothetical protein [Megalodesulfovibrio paquesii]